METLDAISITVRLDEGISFTSPGQQLSLAVVDAAGNIVAKEGLAEKLIMSILHAHEQLWLGSGHLTIITPLTK